MNLEPDNLEQHLANEPLARLYIIAGDEPLRSGEAADAVRAAARSAGYLEREAHVVTQANSFPWDATFESLNSLSLFASRRLFELRLPGGKPGTTGAAALKSFAATLHDDTVCIVHLPALNKRAKAAKWAAALSAAGVWIDIRDIPPGRLVGWLQRRAQRAAVDIERQALQLLAARTEGNLLAAQQEIDKLRLLLGDRPITAADVRDSVADGARFTVFQLADAALSQDLGRAMRVLDGLRREGAATPLVSWSACNAASTLVHLWYRRAAGTPARSAFQELRIWGQNQAAYQRALAAHDAGSIRRLGQGVGRLDRVVKGAAPGAPWQALYELVVLLAEPQRSAAAPTLEVA